MILSDLTVGQLGAGNPIRKWHSIRIWVPYPLVCRETAEITEQHPYYGATTWGRADSAGNALDPVHQRSIGFSHLGPAIGLFAAQEINDQRPTLRDLPNVEREIIALSSRRTESN